LQHKNIKTLKTMRVQNTTQFMKTGPLILLQNTFKFIITLQSDLTFNAVVILNASDKPTLRKNALPVLIQNNCTAVFTLHYKISQ
jgi:hypothetical protein